MRETLDSLHLRLPDTYLVSLLAGLTTWLTLLSWTGFAEHSSGYLTPAFGACLMVAVSGMLLRTTRLPAVAVALAQVVLLALWLHARWAGDVATAGWIPNADSVNQVIDTIQASVTASRTYAAPVPRSVPEFYPMLLLAAAGTAVMVDFLACGLRRAPLAGLPLLAVYTAPINILDGGVSWLKFAVAAVSFLFLLASDEALRLAGWGHQAAESDRIFDSQRTDVSTAALWSSARKIGFTATAIAIVVPALIPTFTGSLFGGGGNGDTGGGDAVAISNPMVDLKRDLTRGRDVELVRATTPGDPSYLRLTVLDSFDGVAWRPSGRDIPTKQRATGLVIRPPGLSATVTTRRVPWQVSIDGNFASRWLPTPYPVYSINARGDWRYDASTLDFISAADAQTAANTSYRLSALQLSPSAAQLAEAGPVPGNIFAPYTALPRELPQSVRELARRVTSGERTRFGKAVRLQQWFRTDGGFTYSLARSSGNGVDALEQFLSTGKNGRTGYCEQFAAAMAVMGRAVGIPSRVAVGFLRPDRVSGDTYSYSSHDLHSWPEMYFEGVGWLRFEPTPAARTGAGVPSYTSQQIPSRQPSQIAPSQTKASQANRIDQETAIPGATGGGGAGGGGSRPWMLIGLVGVLVLAALVWVPRLVRGGLRRRRWAAATTPALRAEAGWAELRDSALDLGLAWDDSVTLRHRARDLARAFGRGDTTDALARGEVRGPNADPEATGALHRLVRRVERARFARAGLLADTPTGEAAEPGAASAGAAEPAGPSVQEDVARCVEAMRAGASRRRQTQATWLPMSLLAGLRGWGRTGSSGPGPRALVTEPGVDRAV